jgi:hypothetical protein
MPGAQAPGIFIASQEPKSRNLPCPVKPAHKEDQQDIGLILFFLFIIVVFEVVIVFQFILVLKVVVILKVFIVIF